MISAELERILQHVYADARARKYELIGLEHLLLVLLEQSDDVRTLLQQCGVECNILSEQLISSVVENTPLLPDHLLADTETQPTIGFQRVLQRAIVHVQQADKREVFPLDVLVALMSETDSPAVYFLSLQSVSRYDVLRAIAHGPDEGKGDEGADFQNQSAQDKNAEPNDALGSYTVNLNAEVLAGRIDPLIGRKHEMERLAAGAAEADGHYISDFKRGAAASSGAVPGSGGADHYSGRRAAGVRHGDDPDPVGAGAVFAGGDENRHRPRHSIRSRGPQPTGA